MSPGMSPGMGPRKRVVTFIALHMLGCVITASTGSPLNVSSSDIIHHATPLNSATPSPSNSPPDLQDDTESQNRITLTDYPTLSVKKTITKNTANKIRSKSLKFTNLNANEIKNSDQIPNHFKPSSIIDNDPLNNDNKFVPTSSKNILNLFQKWNGYYFNSNGKLYQDIKRSPSHYQPNKLNMLESGSNIHESMKDHQNITPSPLTTTTTSPDLTKITSNQGVLNHNNSDGKNRVVVINTANGVFIPIMNRTNPSKIDNVYYFPNNKTKYQEGKKSSEDGMQLDDVIRFNTNTNDGRFDATEFSGKENNETTSISETQRILKNLIRKLLRIDVTSSGSLSTTHELNIDGKLIHAAIALSYGRPYTHRITEVPMSEIQAINDLYGKPGISQVTLEDVDVVRPAGDESTSLADEDTSGAEQYASAAEVNTNRDEEDTSVDDEDVVRVDQNKDDIGIDYPQNDEALEDENESASQFSRKPTKKPVTSTTSQPIRITTTKITEVDDSQESEEVITKATTKKQTNKNILRSTTTTTAPEIEEDESRMSEEEETKPVTKKPVDKISKKPIRTTKAPEAEENNSELSEEKDENVEKSPVTKKPLNKVTKKPLPSTIAPTEEDEEDEATVKKKPVNKTSKNPLPSTMVPNEEEGEEEKVTKKPVKKTSKKPLPSTMAPNDKEEEDNSPEGSDEDTSTEESPTSGSLEEPTQLSDEEDEQEPVIADAVSVEEPEATAERPVKSTVPIDDGGRVELNDQVNRVEEAVTTQKTRRKSVPQITTLSENDDISFEYDSPNNNNNNNNNPTITPFSDHLIAFDPVSSNEQQILPNQTSQNDSPIQNDSSIQNDSPIQNDSSIENQDGSQQYGSTSYTSGEYDDDDSGYYYSGEYNSGGYSSDYSGGDYGSRFFDDSEEYEIFRSKKSKNISAEELDIDENKRNTTEVKVKEEEEKESEDKEGDEKEKEGDEKDQEREEKNKEKEVVETGSGGGSSESSENEEEGKAMKARKARVSRKRSHKSEDRVRSKRLRRRRKNQKITVFNRDGRRNKVDNAYFKVKSGENRREKQPSFRRTKVIGDARPNLHSGDKLMRLTRMSKVTFM